MPKKSRTTHHNITAIIYNKKGKILSIGKNSYIKTHPLMYEISKELNPLEEPQRIYLHAEIDAIIRCAYIENAYKILVFRINAKNEYALAKPCEICESAINKTGIRLIEYSINGNAFITEEI